MAEAALRWLITHFREVPICLETVLGGARTVFEEVGGGGRGGLAVQYCLFVPTMKLSGGCGTYHSSARVGLPCNHSSKCHRWEGKSGVQGIGKKELLDGGGVAVCIIILPTSYLEVGENRWGRSGYAVLNRYIR